VNTIDVGSVLLEAALSVADALQRLPVGSAVFDPPKVRGPFGFDLVADQAALKVLLRAGLGVFSEESGLHCPERAIRVVLDPVDGSTNLSRGIPFFGTSLCAFDANGMLASTVMNVASGKIYEAARGSGARRDGHEIHVAAPRPEGSELIAVCGDRHDALPSVTARAFGAAALELCLVAEGNLDGYVCAGEELPIWDYAAGALIVREAGGLVLDRGGRALDLSLESHGRSIIACGSVMSLHRWFGASAFAEAHRREG
jgi:fructose-1,6-bisphosphatase/inositol monophosphatase family enzyme